MDKDCYPLSDLMDIIYALVEPFEGRDINKTTRFPRGLVLRLEDAATRFDTTTSQMIRSGAEFMLDVLERNDNG